MNGIINVYKPKDCTSQHVVSVVRKFLHTKSVGHMGTLDPQGEGVLPIGVGKATRLFDLLLKKFTKRNLISVTKPIHWTRTE